MTTSLELYATLANRFIQSQCAGIRNLLRELQAGRFLAIEHTVFEGIPEFQIVFSGREQAEVIWDNRHLLTYPEELNFRRIVLRCGPSRIVLREIMPEVRHPLTAYGAVEILRQEQRPAAIYTFSNTDEGLRLLLANEAMNRLTGQSPNALFYADWEEALQFRSEVLNQIRDIENALLTTDGVWVHANSNALDKRATQNRLCDWMGEHCRLAIYLDSHRAGPC